MINVSWSVHDTTNINHQKLICKCLSSLLYSASHFNNSITVHTRWHYQEKGKFTRKTMVMLKFSHKKKKNHKNIFSFKMSNKKSKILKKTFALIFDFNTWVLLISWVSGQIWKKKIKFRKLAKIGKHNI